MKQLKNVFYKLVLALLLIFMIYVTYSSIFNIYTPSYDFKPIILIILLNVIKKKTNTHAPIINISGFNSSGDLYMLYIEQNVTYVTNIANIINIVLYIYFLIISII